ncbi:chloride channel protein [Pedobacter insulae]|uniref:Chloride channel protein, CIC family n=1 Tax=Pedobacter insulae TaxID=414048 RepID=A0A1I2XJ26_9SPHI|nr:chloride channel protein [Pedobacter insulae]SFH12706.1 chloride channel protein, CIC family [Pedobacter insulae]
MRIEQKKKYHSFLKFKRDFQKSSLKKVRSYEIVIYFLKNRLSRNQFLILSGILVGTTAGLAGVLLKTLVHYIHFFISHRVHLEYQSLFYLVFPFLGIVLTTLVVMYVYNGQDRKGIGAILYEIAQNSSIVSHVKMYSQIIQSAITVGLGGSAGLESPIAVTGSAIGSNFAQTYKLDYKERTLLLAAGATAGIASAFNAPIAGMMFAFEILLTGVVFTDFIPLVVAAVCGSLVSRIALQEDILFLFRSREAFDYHNSFFYIVLGLFAGLYARYFVIVSQWVERLFHRLKFSKIRKAVIGGLILSALCVLFPPLFGEGYETVKSFTNGNTDEVLGQSFFRYFKFSEWLVIIFLLFVCLLKAFATSTTIFSGGNGGNFAPSLFAGGTLGYLFATVCTLIGINDVPTTNLVLVGMAGVMSGVLYAPLTAIFLIAESSSGYDLFIPLMIVAVISHLMAKWFSPISPDLRQLAEDGKIFTTEHDRNLLNRMNIANLIDMDSQLIPLGASSEQMMEIISKGKKNAFAIVDLEGKLCGLMSLDDIRPFLFKDPNQPLPISKLIKAPPALAHPNDDMADTIRKFDETGTWHLPVVDHQNKFIGFLSKSAILTSYRQMLKEYS